VAAVVTEVFAGIPVADRAAAFAWYERLFGRPPDFFPNENEAVWRLAEHAWIYVVGDPERAGSALHTLLVDDIEDLVAELAGRGLETGPIETLPGAARKAEITDPDGNRITFGEPLPG
jgi:catechol 2,3-dioxygenase-like lactoylglutathione lyase family enzyme